MSSMSVLCPLCAQTSFSSIDALRSSLIKTANGPLACPICHDLFLGLDKLTIHLFSHTNIMNAHDSSTTTNSAIKHTQKIRQPLNTSNCCNYNDDTFQTNTSMSSLHQHTHPEQVYFESTQHNHLMENGKFAQTEPMRKSKICRTNIKKINKKPQMSADVKDLPPSPTILTNVASGFSSEPSATCDICEFTFRNEQVRDMHVRLVHQNLVYSTNIMETKTDPLPNDLSAAAQDSDADFKCHLCSKIFKMKGSLRVHLKVVHLMGLPYVNNSPKLSICERIRHKEESKQLKALNASNQGSNTNNLYDLHPIALIPTLPTESSPLQNMGGIKVTNVVPETEFITNTDHDSNALVVLGNTDDQQTKSNHTKDNSIGSLTTRISSTEVGPSTVALTTTTDSAKIWECDVCSKAFTTKYFLKKHKRLHTGEMPYACELCARTFTFQQSYHKHLLYHSDEKPHVCATCGRAFKELSTLHNHERIHSGEKPFKCDVCGKSFRQRVSFLVHSRIHTGVMPYKCDLCQKSFRYKVSQRTHKCQHAPTEENVMQNEPAALENISVNFIKAFLENSTISPSNCEGQHASPLGSPGSIEIASINEKIVEQSTASESPPSTLNEQQALLTKTIDDIVVESCNKLGIGKGSTAGFTPLANFNEGSMSPSQRLQNMRLYSPQLVTPDLNAIDGDLTRFFLQNSDTGQNN